MIGWHHQLNGHEFEQAPEIGDGQGGMACCNPWGCKESDSTEPPNWLYWSQQLLKKTLLLFWPNTQASDQKKKKKKKKKGMLDRVVHSTKWGSLLHVSHSAYSFVISSLSSPFFKLLNWKQNFLQSPPLIFLPPCPVFVGPYWDFTVLELSHQTVNHPGKLSIKAPFFCQWLSLVLFGPFN